MLNTNTFNIKALDYFNHKKQLINIDWLQHRHVSDHFELSNQYATIYQKYKQEKKWVLFINPEENAIEKLAKIHNIDVSKILMVNDKSRLVNRAKIALKHIVTVLTNNNCSAVILPDNTYTTDEIAQLESAAKLGKTHCFLMKQCPLH